jgi:hypothetical protein
LGLSVEGARDDAPDRDGYGTVRRRDDAAVDLGAPNLPALRGPNIFSSLALPGST